MPIVCVIVIVIIVKIDSDHSDDKVKVVLFLRRKHILGQVPGLKLDLEDRDAGENDAFLCSVLFIAVMLALETVSTQCDKLRSTMNMLITVMVG